MVNHDNVIGKVIDGYRVEKLLGRGGMARVYRAIDSNLDRYVALKIIDPKSGDDPAYRERFRTEARAIAQLQHPNIVSLYRFGDVEGLYYMAMGYVDGADLRWLLDDYLKHNELMPYDSVCRIVGQVAKALDYAHKQGVIHRDIKPSNIMLTTEGEAILTDFGLALKVDEGTRGETFGSAYYIAPEQAMSSSGVVSQSDLYSLGVTLYEMLTGRVPFQDGTMMQIAMAHLSDPVPDPREFNPNLHPAFLPILETALAKEPQDRYATGARLIAALKTALSESKKSSTARKTVARPIKAQSPDDRPTSSPLELSQTEAPQRIAIYRAAHPLTTPSATVARVDVTIAPSPVAKPKTKSRLPSLIFALILIGIVISGGLFALNSGLLSGLANNLPAIGGEPANNNNRFQLVTAPLNSPGGFTLEGRVQAVNGSTLTVHGITITLPADHALLETVKIADLIQVQGGYTLQPNGSIVLNSVTAALINGQVVP